MGGRDSSLLCYCLAAYSLSPDLILIFILVLDMKLRGVKKGIVKNEREMYWKKRKVYW